MMQTLWKTVWGSLKKLKMVVVLLPHDPEIPFLSVYPKTMRTLVRKNTRTPKLTQRAYDSQDTDAPNARQQKSGQGCERTRIAQP